MKRARKYRVVDVFTSRPLFGNPVAVVLDAAFEGSQSRQIRHEAEGTERASVMCTITLTTAGAVSTAPLQPRRRLGVTGVTVFGARGDGEADIEVRTFAPSCVVNEDPVCGSGNGSVAAFRWVRGLLPRSGCEYIAAQGRVVGRDGRVRVNVDKGGQIRVGGACVTCVDGTLAL